MIVPCADPALKNQIKDLVMQQPGISITVLAEKLGEDSIGTIYGLIKQREIYADLEAVPLSKQHAVRLYEDEITSKFFSSTHSNEEEAALCFDPADIIPGTIYWDGLPVQLKHVSSKVAYMHDQEGHDKSQDRWKFEELLRNGNIKGFRVEPSVEMAELFALNMEASPKDKKAALERYERIKPLLSGGETADTNTPIRTLRFWKARYLQFESSHKNGLLGLLFISGRRGNRHSRVSKKVRKTMNDVIKDHYEQPRQIGKFAAYSIFLDVCKKKRIKLADIPCYKTFRNAILARMSPEQIGKMKGFKARHQAEGPYTGNGTILNHPERAWEVAFIDHTPLDIELGDTENSDLDLPTAWLTIMRDARSKKVLAHAISFDDPSHVQCMMVIQECVRRHNRLPQLIYVDNGPEFHSIYFQLICAENRIHIQWRPVGMPKFGAPIETFFNLTNKEFVYLLEGNTQNRRNPRLLTRETNPRKRKTWTLPKLEAELSRFLYEDYETGYKEDLGQSPRDAFQASMKKYPSQKFIPYDRNFEISTFSTTRKGTAKVVRTKGVKVFRVFYWNNIFYDPKIIGTQVPLRFDPLNIGVVFVYAKGQWWECLPPKSLLAQLQNHSVKELKIASKEIRQQHRVTRKLLYVKATTLASRISRLNASESVLKQQATDAELRTILKSRGVRSATRQEINAVSVETPVSQPCEEITTFGQVV